MPTTGSGGNADGIADVLGIGCDKGTENDDTGPANLEFSTRGVRGAVSPAGKH